jgi:DNA-binding transcriptional ArsR family regulator
MHAMDALGNPVRRDILLALRHRPLAVHEIASRFPVSRPAISRHVRLLEEAGLVEASWQGRECLYSIRLQGFQSVREFLDGFWDVALTRLAQLANEEEDS